MNDKLRWAIIVAAFGAQLGCTDDNNSAHASGDAGADATTVPRDATSEAAANPGLCETIKPCPNETAPTQEQIEGCQGLLALCPSELTALVQCTFTNKVCTNEGKFDDNASLANCTTENEAFANCLTGGEDDAGNDGATGDGAAGDGAASDAATDGSSDGSTD